MSIVKRDGMNFYDGLNSACIAIESDNIENYLNYIKKHQINYISLSNLFYTKSNIDFLKEIPFVEKLSITSSTVVDYTGLMYLKQLKSLTLEEPQGKVDLCNNISLEELSTEMGKNIINITNLSNLKVLRIWKYRPQNKNLVELGSLSSLEELYITQSPIISLKGCGRLKNLKKLELNYLSKIEYIDEIELNANTLNSLRFDSCKKIKNHDYVARLNELELLAFDECGEIQSISFIRNLTKLKSFIFVNTNIADGDLSPCVGLEYVGFLNKKHYSHKSEDFKKK